MAVPFGTYRKELERICESAIRCQKIVKNLLSFSRAHKPERRYLGVNGIIEKTLDLKRYQLEVNDVRLSHELAAHLPQTMLARGVQCYLGNTGYGWGLVHGIGYGERVVEIFTEELTSSSSLMPRNSRPSQTICLTIG